MLGQKCFSLFPTLALLNLLIKHTNPAAFELKLLVTRNLLSLASPRRDLLTFLSGLVFYNFLQPLSLSMYISQSIQLQCSLGVGVYLAYTDTGAGEQVLAVSIGPEYKHCSIISITLCHGPVFSDNFGGQDIPLE